MRAARELRRLGERLARRSGLAGAQQRVAAGEQDRAGVALGVGELERVERAGEALCRVLVGEAVERAAARADEHRGGAAGVGGLEQVCGDLVEVAVFAESAERVRGAPVQPLAAEHVELVQDGLAHQRVGELEAPRRGGRPEEARAEDLVERGLRDVGLEARDGLQRARILLEAEDRRDGEQLVGGIGEPREADADGMAHALRHLRRPRLGQSVQHLLDEERVAAGARVDAGGDVVLPEQRPGERGHVVRFKPAQPDAIQRAVALEIGQRAGERAAAAELGVAVGADDLQRAGAGRAQHEAREQQRAAVGPVEVVDDQQQRRALGERGVDGVEQAVPRAGLVARAGLERVGGAGLAQRLGERLERCERLLRAAAEQDGGVVGERGGGELVGESGLAHSRLAGQQHEPAVAVHLHAGPGRAQPLELGAATDELGRVGAFQRSWRRHRGGRHAPQPVEQRTRLA